jgi:hypothetical protein
MGEQGVQERAEKAPLWGPSVEDHRGGDVVSYPHRLGESRQKVQDPVAQGRVETQGHELNDKSGGYYGVKCGAVSITASSFAVTFSTNNCCFSPLPQQVRQKVRGNKIFPYFSAFQIRKWIRNNVYQSVDRDV